MRVVSVSDPLLGGASGHLDSSNEIKHERSPWIDESIQNILPETIHQMQWDDALPGEARHRVRLSDVAARAGVSVGSASQAFSRPELVSDKIRTRVLQAGEALGGTGSDPPRRRL